MQREGPIERVPSRSTPLYIQGKAGEFQADAVYFISFHQLFVLLRFPFNTFRLAHRD